MSDPTAPHPAPTPEALAAALRGAGLRVTRPRTAVLTAVAGHPHAVTEEILDSVHAQAPDVSRQAVYDVLHALTDAGLVRKIQPAGHVARYEARIGDNHHHLVCRECGDVQDVDCSVGHAPCLTPLTDRGYQIDEAEVVYWGVCPRCAAAASPPAPDRP
ncbi:MAG: transcriptional repressor [Gordonia sp. (in: high G+C Gram-positive bacteria)]|uniref:Fur family transcriptional regulator n=1 Tax=Gordonia sp. (in: high G+C Gram-positive bacteria) TaxID=84139 RepID=UPI0039E2428E